jgi:hypothetical protein
MGQAKRRKTAGNYTLDGGDPSDDRIALMVDVFDVSQEIDGVRSSAIASP